MNNEIDSIIGELSGKLEKASKLKAWDVYVKDHQEIAISAERGAIKSAESISSIGYAIRVYAVRGNLGFAYSNILTEDAYERTVQAATRMAAATTPDPDFHDLPEPSEISVNGPSFVDEATRDASEEDIFEILSTMLDRHGSNPRLYSTSCNASAASGTLAIASNHGILVEEESTSAGVSFEAVIRDNSEQVSGWWYDAATNLAEINPAAISDKAVERAEAGLHRQVIHGGEWPVILGPHAVSSLILDPLADAIDAEKVQYERSFLKDALGTQIASENFTVTDDPHHPRLTGSEYYDDEGVPTRNLDLVKDGTLLTLLHNSYTAYKAGAELTGHAARQGISSIPSIAPHNLIFPAGDVSLEEMLEGVQYGVYLDYTGASPNLATGDFSGLILNGQLIENGELGPALLNTLVAANLMDLFNRVEMVGKDLTTWGSTVTPHVKIKSARITSGE